MQRPQHVLVGTQSGGVVLCDLENVVRIVVSPFNLQSTWHLRNAALFGSCHADWITLFGVHADFLCMVLLSSDDS